MLFDLHTGDCRDVLRVMPADQFDSVVCDPPYHLTAGKKGGSGAASLNPNSPAGRSRIGTGFMGKKWDGGDVAFRPETWADILRVTKPGGYLVAFGGTRTFHRLMVAIEDGGWEIRDTLMWIYSQGFPKSHNGDHGGTALKPAWEPIVLARKRHKGTIAANYAQHGVGGLRIDDCLIETDEDLSGGAYAPAGGRNVSPSLSPTGMNRPGATAGEFVQPPGRWPANVLHDGSEEVVACFPYSLGQKGSIGERGSARLRTVYEGGELGDRPSVMRGDTGSAARFFYQPKVSTKERNLGMPAGMVNDHPTLKPIAVMRWLARLVTPAGGHVLDPFAGSFTAGCAALLEGLAYTGIDLEDEHVAIGRYRMAACVPVEDLV